MMVARKPRLSATPNIINTELKLVRESSDNATVCDLESMPSSTSLDKSFNEMDCANQSQNQYNNNNSPPLQSSTNIRNCPTITTELQSMNTSHFSHKPGSNFSIDSTAAPIFNEQPAESNVYCENATDDMNYCDNLDGDLEDCRGSDLASSSEPLLTQFGKFLLSRHCKLGNTVLLEVKRFQNFAFRF